MSSRKFLLVRIAKHLVKTLPAQTICVAIDGVDGAGKTTFADDLGVHVSALGRPVIRASADGFHHPKSVRYRQGRHSPKGFFEDSYDYSAMKKYLLEPLSDGGSRRYCRAYFDHVTDEIVPVVEIEALPLSVLLMDGIFLHRPELLRYWNVSIFPRTEFAVSVARCAARDGSSPDPAAASNRRYVEGQRL